MDTKLDLLFPPSLALFYSLWTKVVVNVPISDACTCTLLFLSPPHLHLMETQPAICHPPHNTHTPHFNFPSPNCQISLSQFSFHDFFRFVCAPLNMDANMFSTRFQWKWWLNGSGLVFPIFFIFITWAIGEKHGREKMGSKDSDSLLEATWSMRCVCV